MEYFCLDFSISILKFDLFCQNINGIRLIKTQTDLLSRNAQSGNLHSPHQNSTQWESTFTSPEFHKVGIYIHLTRIPQSGNLYSPGQNSIKWESTFTSPEFYTVGTSHWSQCVEFTHEIHIIKSQIMLNPHRFHVMCSVG